MRKRKKKRTRTKDKTGIKNRENTKDKNKNEASAIQKHEDAALKTAMRYFAEELLPYLGIKGEVKGYAPTEIIHLELKRFLEDFNLIMDDGSWKHFEFQSTNEGTADLRRFRSYEAVMSQHYKVPITTYVLYSGNIRKPMTELKEGENTYQIIPIIMRDKDADRLIEGLEKKVKEGEDLSRNDLVPLSLCLLMGGKMALVDRVKAAFEIIRKVKGVRAEDVAKLEAVLYVMADKFLKQEEMEKIKEEIGMMKLSQVLFDMGKEEGKSEGRSEGRSEGIKEGIDQVNRLYQRLVDEKKYEDLERSTRDKEYQRSLFKKYSIL